MRNTSRRKWVRAWDRFCGWLLMARGYPCPQQALDLVDYLFARAAAPCPSTALRTCMGLFAFMEETAGFLPQERLSSSPLVRAAVRDLEAQLPEGREPKQAPCMHVAILRALEQLVVDAGVAEYRRMFVQSWGCLRLDDQRGMDPGRIAVLDTGVDFPMLRTKTTGPAKKVLTKHAFVSYGAFCFCRAGLAADRANGTTQTTVNNNNNK